MTPPEIAHAYLAAYHPAGLTYAAREFYRAEGGVVSPAELWRGLWGVLKAGEDTRDWRDWRSVEAALRHLRRECATADRPMSPGAIAAWLTSFHRFVEVKNKHEVTPGAVFLNGYSWGEALMEINLDRPRGMTFTLRHSQGAGVFHIRNYEPFHAGLSCCFREVRPGSVTRAFWRGLPIGAPEPLPLGLDMPVECDWDSTLGRWVTGPEIPPPC